MALFTPNIALFSPLLPTEFFGEIRFEAPGTYTVEIDDASNTETTGADGVVTITYSSTDDRYYIPNGVAAYGGFTAVVVGGGGGASGGDGSDGGMGGGGGALAYMNNLSVSQGDVFTLTVGAGGSGRPKNSSLSADNGGDTTFRQGGTTHLRGGGGVGGTRTLNTNVSGGTSSGASRAGGGDGGASGTMGPSDHGTGGGGAGGYSGDGGKGFNGQQASLTSLNLGSGGGGAGGNRTNLNNSLGTYTGGGGVALFGEGTSGTVIYDPDARVANAATQGSLNVAPSSALVAAQQFGHGRGFGAGGGGMEDDYSGAGGDGADGAIRLIFGGDGAGNGLIRSFPSTNVSEGASLGTVVIVTGPAGAGTYSAFSKSGP